MSTPSPDLPRDPVYPATAVATEDRTVAILSYVTIVGFIVAIVMHGGKKTDLGAYHLRQALGLLLVGIGFSIATMIIGYIPVINLLLIVVVPIGWLAILALVIMGLIAAANGEKKPLPVVGPQFQQWFAGAFV